MGVETMFSKGKRSKKRTSRRARLFSAAERRRLLQLGVSMLIFVVVLLGRNVSPEGMERWSEVLRYDADFRGALSGFGEAAADGEPFLDAFGELCLRVFAGGEEETGGGTGTPPLDDAPALSLRFVARMRGEDLPSGKERVGA